MTVIETISEHVVDIAAIGAIGFMAYHGVVSTELATVVATIALGKRYMSLKNGN